MREVEEGGIALDPVIGLLKSFLTDSRKCLFELLEEAKLLNKVNREDRLFSVMHRGKPTKIKLDGTHFFLRTSTEYSSPQLTLEEAQGIIAARLLEACGNYLLSKNDRNLEHKDLIEISESLKKPPSGQIIPYLLNADDAEPDRYSNNPLRASIVDSGQSAFPSANVKTSSLKMDPNFISKYKGSLITVDEVEFMENHLQDVECYVDFVDFVKYDALEKLSKSLGIELCIPSIRMPLGILAKEKRGDPLHAVIEESHSNYEAIKAIYMLMGRSMKKKTTLLTAPHSMKGFGSKRSAKGKILFDGSSFSQIKVRYRTIKLYPNMVDMDDISVAKADDSFFVEAKDIINYSYVKTPSTPQFALYVVHSPEDASISHGAGAYAGSNMLKSHHSIYEAYVKTLILEKVPGTRPEKSPLILNLVPKKIWLHPEHKNLDASIGCISNPLDLLGMGMAIEHLTF